jgi:polysaccharide pyruvyl transferase WcaK-like protein
MTSAYLYGTFAGNRGDVLMSTAARRALEARGVAVIDDEEKADAILNCCGYWCGDLWGELWSRAMRERIVRWKDSGKKVILLPQTFGPFTDERIAHEIRVIADNSDLLCARDEVSFKFLSDVCGGRPSFQQFPDYTIDVEPIPSDVFQPSSDAVAVIPNLRMTDKTDARTSALYPSFLGNMIALLRDNGTDPFLLIHEEKDTVFADALRQEYADLTVVIEPDAQKTKWIIGHSRAVVSSRYHGILNALYQDIPVLATGWCHKFPALMKEWQMPDNMIAIDLTDEEMKTHVQRLLNREAWKNSAPERGNVRQNYRELTDTLWETVVQALI